MIDGPIGIFDSGVGGLTVLQEIKKAMPKENIVYLGDTLNFPYGAKPKEEIIKYAIDNTKFLISKDVKVVVIACGTVTSQAIDVLMENFDIPIIGIIEPTVAYIENLNLKEVGVIATEGTIRSGAWEKKIKEKIPDIEVINKACPMLANIAEEGRATSKEGKDAIKEYMKLFKERRINNIILGCTHYPIYETVIREELGYDVNLINTGKSVAKYLSQILNNQKSSNLIQETKVYLSKPTPEFKKIASSILNEDVDIIDKNF